MITIINTPSSMYEGMSMADAAGQMVLECNNIIHEFEMDVLLSEHAYLYENACEVEYFVENRITEAGKSLVAKAQAAIEKVRQVISDLWHKLVDWVTTKVTEIKKKFIAAKNFTKEKVIGAYNAVVAKGAFAKEQLEHMFTNKWIFDVDFKNFSSEGYISDMKDEVEYTKAGQYYAEVKKHAKVRDTDFIIEKATTAVFDINSMVKDIKQAQKDADDNLKKMADTMKRTANFNPDTKNDVISETMTKLNACLNNNSVVCRDKIKLYTEFTNESIKLAVKFAKKPQ